MKQLAISFPGYAPSTTQTLQVSGIPSGGSVTLASLISFTINTLVIVGIIATLIFLIWGGISWITSGGDKEKVDKARKTIIMAIVGFFIVVISVAVIRFIGTMLGVSSLSSI